MRGAARHPEFMLFFYFKVFVLEPHEGSGRAPAVICRPTWNSCFFLAICLSFETLGNALTGFVGVIGAQNMGCLCGAYSGISFRILWEFVEDGSFVCYLFGKMLGQYSCLDPRVK